MTQLTLPLHHRNNAYHSLELGNRQEEVLTVIKQYNGISNREISVALRLPVNCVTGRVKELRDKGLVTEAGSIKDNITNKKVTTWRAT